MQPRDPPAPVVLHEHKDSEVPIELTLQERDALQQLVPRMTFAPVPDSRDSYVLNPRNTVGAVQVGDRRFEFRPKLAVRRLAFVLAYAMDPAHWQSSGFDFGEDADIFESVVPGFAFQVERAMRRGPLFGYRLEEEALQTVRGRIRFDDQLRSRFGILPPIECRFDEFTEDIDINRMLKAAISRLSRIRIRSQETRRRLRTLAARFPNVTSVAYDPRNLPDVQWNRLNERFRPAIELARLILRSRSIELRGGEARAEAFLLDMSSVFETFVVVALREQLGLSTSQFPQQARGRQLHLARGPALGLKPDLSWWEDGACIFVGDVKYKKTPASEGVLHPDVYQLLAYTTATGIRSGMLIYAAGEAEEQTFSIRSTDKQIEVRTLDLEQPPERVLDQIAVTGERITRTRARRGSPTGAAGVPSFAATTI